ncbi:hypothetical protein KIPB_002128, partial [Kipferlia bialata]
EKAGMVNRQYQADVRDGHRIHKKKMLKRKTGSDNLNTHKDIVETLVVPDRVARDIERECERTRQASLKQYGLSPDTPSEVQPDLAPIPETGTPMEDVLRIKRERLFHRAVLQSRWDEIERPERVEWEERMRTSRYKSHGGGSFRDQRRRQIENRNKVVPPPEFSADTDPAYQPEGETETYPGMSERCWFRFPDQTQCMLVKPDDKCFCPYHQRYIHTLGGVIGRGTHEPHDPIPEEEGEREREERRVAAVKLSRATQLNPGSQSYVVRMTPEEIELNDMRKKAVAKAKALGKGKGASKVNPFPISYKSDPMYKPEGRTKRTKGYTKRCWFRFPDKTQCMLFVKDGNCFCTYHREYTRIVGWVMSATACTSHDTPEPPALVAEVTDVEVEREREREEEVEREREEDVETEREREREREMVVEVTEEEAEPSVIDVPMEVKAEPELLSLVKVQGDQEREVEREREDVADPAAGDVPMGVDLLNGAQGDAVAREREMQREGENWEEAKAYLATHSCYNTEMREEVLRVLRKYGFQGQK